MPVELPPAASDPPFRTVFDYWQRKAPPGRLPGRQHIDPTELPKALLPWILLIEVVTEGRQRRFRYRLVGTQVSALFGGDITGRFMDEVVAPRWQAEIFAALNFVCEERQAHYLMSRISIRERDFMAVKRLALPLASDGDTVDMIMGLFVPVVGTSAGTASGRDRA
jgi:hypothetical protein